MAPCTGNLYPENVVQRELECTSVSPEPSSCYMISWCATWGGGDVSWPGGVGQWQSVCKECEDSQLLGSGWGSCITAVWLFSSPVSPVFWCGIYSVLVPSLLLKSSLVIWTCDILHPRDALSSFCFDIDDTLKKKKKKCLYLRYILLLPEI